MKHAASMTTLALTLLAGCGGGSESKAQPGGPTGNPPVVAESYACFRVDAPATQTTPAGPRGMCARSVDDCNIARGTVLDSLAKELGPDAALAPTACGPQDRVHCTNVVTEAGASYNACGPDAAICSWLKGNLVAAGKAQTGECLEFPSSRLNLPAVAPIGFHMWCFRDQTTSAGSDCQPTQRACETKVTALSNQGIVKPLAWPDGALCARHDKVVCYPQLQRAQEQVKFICTPSFEECQARQSEVRGPDFQVLGACGLVTGNKPW